MLEKIPHALGAALSGVEAGLERTAYQSAFPNVPETLTLVSGAFADGAAIPARFTEDGERLSPPLAWSGLPAAPERVVLLVEDAGSPTPQPLVHLILWDLARDLGALDEGDLPSPAGPGRRADLAGVLGQNSFLKAAWLAPDPPTGHGTHVYLFQAYALDTALDLRGVPGRHALLDAMRGRVLAKGRLTGTYARS